ncbi:uncharacterized protein LOC110644554 [Hevea brasiliensis]|uniref:uncharacterized protein LOC110644554 n=1 Tax=Hevea brasiliensis TaxID=3981 RepID=UPI0025D214E0|nr:uncharacterized protein LOC110644554 [Hevea brasiliensis]
MDRADACYHNWILGEGSHSWKDFEKDLCRRFGEDGLEDVVEEIMKMRQEGTVEEYQDKFEDRRIRLERVMPNLGEAYFLSAFVGGLRDDIRPMVRMMKPTTLFHDFEIAKYQEQLLSCSKKVNSVTRPHQNNFRPSYSSTFVPKNTSSQSPYFLEPKASNWEQSSIAKPINSVKKPSISMGQSSVNQPINKVSSNMLVTHNTIRSPRSCFKCGKKFFPGHQCKQKTLMALQLQENDASVFQIQNQEIDEGEEV